MKKIIQLSLLFFIQNTNAQSVDIAFRTHFLYPFENGDYQTLSQTVKTTLNKDTFYTYGFNAGTSVKINFKNLFIMPEVYYTDFTTTYNLSPRDNTLKYNQSRVDMPISVGYNLLDELCSIYTGLVGSYTIQNNIDEILLIDSPQDFTFGYQVGVQTKISKLIISLKYESSLSKNQIQTLNNLQEKLILTHDHRPSLLLLGVGINL